jgi:hypothetical protein
VARCLDRSLDRDQWDRRARVCPSARATTFHIERTPRRFKRPSRRTTHISEPLGVAAWVGG